MPEIIKLENITVTFPELSVPAVNDVSLSIAAGDIFGVIGYSGAGKSTLVRVINLLQLPTAGSVSVNGAQFFADNRIQISATQLRKERRKIGMIFQHFNLLAEQTVTQNVAFALKHSGLNKAAIQAKVADLLGTVELSEYANSYPAQLSGGQKQRVAIARALANDPTILISDEATSALDPKNTKQILELLQKLNRERGLTIVLITHEMKVIKKIAHKIAVIKDGTIIETGKTSAVFLNPQQPLTREFIENDSDQTEILARLQRMTTVESKQPMHFIRLVTNASDDAVELLSGLNDHFETDARIVFNETELFGTELENIVTIATTTDPATVIDWLRPQVQFANVVEVTK